MLAHIQDNTHKAYVALQSYVTSPSNIPIPGAIHTDRIKLTREQMAARYLKSIEGNPDIDINKPSSQANDNKTPKMVQKSPNTQAKEEWPSIGQRDTSGEIKTLHAKRRLLDTQNCESGASVSKYLATIGNSGKLNYEFVGLGNQDTVCLADTPEFIVCSDQYLPSAKVRVLGYPSQELQIRSTLGGDTPTDGKKINAEIHATLQNNPATRVYLTPAQLDSYISWRLSNGGSANFEYIRVDDTENVNARSGQILGGLAAVFGFMLPAAYGCAALCARQDKKLEKKNPPDAIQNAKPALQNPTGARNIDKAKLDQIVVTPPVLKEVSSSSEPTEVSSSSTDITEESNYSSTNAEKNSITPRNSGSSPDVTNISDDDF